MPKQQRNEENKKKNEHFIIAFDHFATAVFKCSQKKLAQMMGTESSRISELRNGKTPVNDETIDSLIQVSVEAGMQIFREYLLGNSDIMLLANVTDEEMVAAKRRATDPDYDVMQARLKEKEKQPDTAISQTMTYIDPASQQNASLSAYIQLTNRLTDDLKKKEIEMEERLAEKDARIAELKDTIAAKEEIIKARDAEIINLKRQLAAATTGDLSRYPFAIGAAEDNKQPNI